MTLKHPNARCPRRPDLAVAPHFNLETRTIPRRALPEAEMPPDVAYQIIHDELMLDGNARLQVCWEARVHDAAYGSAFRH